MAFGTFAELRASLANWMARPGEALIEDLAIDAIALAEAHFNRKLRVGDMETNATGSSTNGVLVLPTDFQAVRRVAVATYGDLELVMPDWASSRFPSGAEGIPSYYTIQGLTLTTYPSFTGDVSLDYYASIPALSATNTTNWLLTAHPDLYLAQCLGQLHAFTGNAEKAGAWFSQAAGVIGEMNEQDRSRRYSQASIKTKGSTP